MRAIGRSNRCQRRPRSARSRVERTAANAIQRGSAWRSRSPTRVRSTLPRTRTRATIEITAPTRARIADPLRISPRASRRSGRRPRRLRRSCRQLRRATDADAVEEVAGHDPQRGQPVDDAALEPDGARFVEVPRRDRDLADSPSHPRRDDLGDQLLVEDEVVAVELVRDRLEEAPAVGPEAGVVLREAEAEGDVLDGREE